jgi:hypothetical protein
LYGIKLISYALLWLFEIRIKMGIIKPEREVVRGGWRELLNGELHAL